MSEIATRFAGKRNDLPFLDGVRATAALMVLASHFSNEGLLSFGGWGFSGIGKPGVYLFFFLSAFLLTRIMVEKGRAALTAPALGDYATRRVLRIYPLFLVYLGLALITSIATHFLFGAVNGVPLNMPPATFLRHVLLLEGKGVLWSIVVEFKYYALLPFVAAAFGLAARRGTGMLLLALLGALVLVELTWRRWVPAGDELSLGYYLPIFLGGAALGAWDAVQTIALPARRARVTGPGQISAADIGPQPVPMAAAATVVGLVTVAFVLTIPDTASALVGRPLPPQVFHGEILGLDGNLGRVDFGLALRAYGAAPALRVATSALCRRDQLQPLSVAPRGDPGLARARPRDLAAGGLDPGAGDRASDGAPVLRRD